MPSPRDESESDARGPGGWYILDSEEETQPFKTINRIHCTKYSW